MITDISRRQRSKFSSHTLSEKVTQGYQENKEGKQEREGNEIRKHENPGGGGAVISKGKSQNEKWPAVLDSNRPRLDQEVDVSPGTVDHIL